MDAPARLGHGEAVADGVPAILRVAVLAEPALVIGRAPAPFPPGRPGRLLAELVLARGRTGSSETLIDRIWPDPPADPRATLHTTVRRLRQALGEAGALIVSRPPGYALVRDGVDVDAEEVAADARQAIADRNLTALEDALALWRGEPWGEHADDLAADEVRRLTALRARARGVRAELLLTAGRLDEAVARARELADAEPLSQAPVALLMRALTAAGEVPQALAVFQNHRRRLIDELGLSPSAELLALHQRVLRGESEPAAPTPAPAAGTQAGAAPQSVAPRPPARLYGRSAHLATLAGMLEPGRCLTVVGPGGVGKTTVAARLAADVAGAVWWVDLAELQSEAEVVPAVASRVGVRALGAPLRDAVLSALADARGLLVLDNCEHVLGGVADLVDAVAVDGGGVAVLATSRERLGIGVERAFPLPPLQLPSPERIPATIAEAIDGSPAVAFFVERARSADPGLTWDAAAVRDVTTLVIGLDGLPLAIELAAGRSGAIGFGELRDRLSGHLELIRSETSRLPARHRTLTATLDWSYRLLSPREQDVFRGLAVFAGWFDLAAADAVLGPGASVAVTDLVQRSLLVRRADCGTSDYRMLVTVRAFAAGLADAAERDSWTAAHGTWAVSLAQRCALGLEGADERHWAGAVDRALPDLTAAFGAALAAGDTNRAAALVSALHRWADFRVRPDILSWAGQLLDRQRDGWPPGVYLAAAAHTWMQGSPTDGIELAELAVRAARDQALPLLEGRGHEAAGDLWLAIGDLTRARDAYGRAEAASTAAGNATDALMAACGVLLALTWSGAPVADLVRRVLDALPGTTNPSAHALALYCVGEAWAAGDPGAAAGILTRAIAEADDVGCTLVSSVATTALLAVLTRASTPSAPDLARLGATVENLVASGNQNLLVTLIRNLATPLSRHGRHTAIIELLAALDAVAARRPSWGEEAEALASAASLALSALPADAVQAARRRGAARPLAAAAREAVRVLTDARSAPVDGEDPRVSG